MICEFCGGCHENNQVEGVPIFSCPRLPPEHVYIDDEFDNGPRGKLYRLEELFQKERELRGH